MQYVTLLDERGEVLWVSGTVPGMNAGDVVGKPAWAFASPQVAGEIRGILRRALNGEEVLHTASVRLLSKQRQFQSRWQMATMEHGRFIVITTREVDPKFRRLSRKQIEVLRCLVECDSNAQSSARLGISERTVESHLRNIRKILGITTRHGLVAFALHHLDPL